MLHAVATSFGGFFALRFLLGKCRIMTARNVLWLMLSLTGMCESCVAPTLIQIISMFYKKDEQVYVFIVLIKSDKPTHTQTIGIPNLLVLCNGM